MRAVFSNHEIEAAMEAIQSEQIYTLTHIKQRTLVWLKHETDAELADRFKAQCLVIAIDDALTSLQCTQTTQAVA